MKRLLLLVLLAGCSGDPIGCTPLEIEVTNLYFEGNPVQQTLVEQGATCTLMRERTIFQLGWPFVERTYECVVCKEDL